MNSQSSQKRFTPEKNVQIHSKMFQENLKNKKNHHKSNLWRLILQWQEQRQQNLLQRNPPGLEHTDHPAKQKRIISILFKRAGMKFLYSLVLHKPFQYKIQ
jgi:hypothetical protein